MKGESINIWALAKEQDLKAFLLLLTQEVGESGFSISDETLPNSAIRIAPLGPNPEVAAYIYTYAQPEGLLGVDLEYPLRMQQSADDKTERLNELAQTEALERVIAHLELAL